MYRIEYGGHAEACQAEGHIWLPADLDSRAIELLLGDDTIWSGLDGEKIGDSEIIVLEHLRNYINKVSRWIRRMYQ